MVDPTTRVKPRAALIYGLNHDRDFFDLDSKSQLGELLDLNPQILTKEDILRGDLQKVEVLISGWGSPSLDEEALSHLPCLRAIFHLGGSVKGLVGDGVVFQKGIRVSSTNPELAQTVAEFCLAEVLSASKRVRENESWVNKFLSYPEPRAHSPRFPMKIGLVGYGTIARAFRKLLHGFPYHVLAFDPFLSDEEAKRVQVERVSLEALFRESDLISCHLPHLKTTERMLKKVHFASMRPRAIFLNTARGQVVDEEDLIEVFQERKDLTAVLDVVATEPIPKEHAFHRMKNIYLTPHIAGCAGPECRRLGWFAIKEIENWIQDKPLRGEVLPEDFAIKA